MNYGFAEQDNYQRYVCGTCKHERVYSQTTNFFNDFVTLKWPIKECPECGGLFKPGLGKEFNDVIENIVKNLNERASTS